MYLADTQGLQAARQGWRDIARMIDWVCENWDEPDEGIWETPGAARTSPTDGSRPGSRIYPAIGSSSRGVRLDSAHYRSSKTKRI
jgi:Glycosyl hydrolases family 15